jgi:CHAT domain-containing protein
VPLHAAGIYQEVQRDSCPDFVVSSYTPTLAALVRAQAAPTSLADNQSHIALVGAQKAQDSSLPILWSIQAEIDAVVGTCKQGQISVDAVCIEGPTSTERVVESLKRAAFAHIACHGIQNASNALSSGFHLSQCVLTVSQLVEVDLKNAFVAFLSGCETAKGDEKQSDQTVHPTAAMLFVGSRSVGATMW